MSHFATPIIVVNLGCEMVYVIDQRLKAQNVGLDKSEKVLTDIVTVLLHPKLLDELFIPQPVATHAVIKQLLQAISTTSIMKLDEYSMSKLWDLMTMIFKWQLFVATNQNIFDISRRHLKSVATLLPNYFTKSLLEHAMKRFEYLNNRFTDEDYKSLSSTLILWFSEYHTKISVLLRLDLQKSDGTFSLPVSVDQKIIKNLGENIYKYDNKKNVIDEYEKQCAKTPEINFILGSFENVRTKNDIELQLPINLGSKNARKNKIRLEIGQDTTFENIRIQRKIKDTDLAYNPNTPKSTQEDLLDMLDCITECQLKEF